MASHGGRPLDSNLGLLTFLFLMREQDEPGVEGWLEVEAIQYGIARPGLSFEMRACPLSMGESSVMTYVLSTPQMRKGQKISWLDLFASCRKRRQESQTQQASVWVDGSGQTGWVVEWLKVNNQITPTAYSTTDYEFEFDSQQVHQEIIVKDRYLKEQWRMKGRLEIHNLSLHRSLSASGLGKGLNTAHPHHIENEGKSLPTVLGANDNGETRLLNIKYGTPNSEPRRQMIIPRKIKSRSLSCGCTLKYMDGEAELRKQCFLRAWMKGAPPAWMEDRACSAYFSAGCRQSQASKAEGRLMSGSDSGVKVEDRDRDGGGCVIGGECAYITLPSNWHYSVKASIRGIRSNEHISIGMRQLPGKQVIIPRVEIRHAVNMITPYSRARGSSSCSVWSPAFQLAFRFEDSIMCHHNACLPCLPSKPCSTDSFRATWPLPFSHHEGDGQKDADRGTFGDSAHCKTHWLQLLRQFHTTKGKGSSSPRVPLIFQKMRFHATSGTDGESGLGVLDHKESIPSTAQSYPSTRSRRGVGYPRCKNDDWQLSVEGADRRTQNGDPWQEAWAALCMETGRGANVTIGTPELWFAFVTGSLRCLAPFGGQWVLFGHSACLSKPRITDLIRQLLAEMKFEDCVKRGLLVLFYVGLRRPSGMIIEAKMIVSWSCTCTYPEAAEEMIKTQWAWDSQIRTLSRMPSMFRRQREQKLQWKSTSPSGNSMICRSWWTHLTRSGSLSWLGYLTHKGVPKSDMEFGFSDSYSRKTVLVHILEHPSTSDHSPRSMVHRLRHSILDVVPPVFLILRASQAEPSLPHPSPHSIPPFFFPTS
ncbi:uncharacterized protein CLUP02_12624 [Colletotrichum lupini]|uniref:Uncharacterized protein n=1 Tax=Colletotrichum lupini TaxID=145971 RepID=A0A9Q8T2K9_9PEZI|nr:uncharacterized protein CLUP02_12624 [Colletotrichum lupini]UQC87122.1 hypothetical protein CLUP02_12624 [Colletotrichum lupini]